MSVKVTRRHELAAIELAEQTNFKGFFICETDQFILKRYSVGGVRYSMLGELAKLVALQDTVKFAQRAVG